MCIILWYNQDIVHTSYKGRSLCYVAFIWGAGSWNLKDFHPSCFFYVTLSDWYPPCFHSTLPLQAKTTTVSSISVSASGLVGEVW